MFSNRKMPEAPDLDENRKSIFLTCRSKIVTLCIVTEHQCDSHFTFRAVGSQIILLSNLKIDPGQIYKLTSNTSTPGEKSAIDHFTLPNDTTRETGHFTLPDQDDPTLQNESH